MKFEEVFAEEALLQVVIFKFQGRMCPGDVVIWLLYTASVGWIVKHDLAIADVSMTIDLPEDGGAGPVFRGADKIGVDEVCDGCGIENGFEEGDEVVVFVV